MSIKIAVALLSLPLIISCSQNEEVEPVVRPVRTEIVYATGGNRVRTFSGVSQAGMESQLSFKVGGTVRRVAVRVGDQVDRGDLIAELDPGDYQLRVRETQASLNRAQAESRGAASNYERIRVLYENRNASLQDLEAARTADESASAQVEALRNSLELAQLQLSYTRLSAPVAGAISAVPIEVNENAQAGTPIAVLASGGRPEVSIAVPEQLITRVEEGQATQVRFDAIGPDPFAAHVTEVGIASGGMATTYEVVVTLDQGSEAVRPGMAAEVSFEFASPGGARERFLVPPHAVGEDREGRFVFVAEPAETGFGSVRRRSVTVGELTHEGIEVTSGLNDGDRLVTAGVSRIHDGLRVRLDPAGDTAP